MTRNQNDEVPTLITSGGNTIQISDENFTANGTNTVTISNVAPSAVGTATISKWFKFQDSSGTTYFIPAWT